MTGGWWFHLRRCAFCGHIGCCDNSPSQHASRHAQDSGHPVIASYEPGEDWFYDYGTGEYLKGRQLAPPRHHPLDQPVPGPRGRVPADGRPISTEPRRLPSLHDFVSRAATNRATIRRAHHTVTTVRRSAHLGRCRTSASPRSSRLHAQPRPSPGVREGGSDHQQTRPSRWEDHATSRGCVSCRALHRGVAPGTRSRSDRCPGTARTSPHRRSAVPP
jgi:Zn-finger in ubiquitin-hydrolases and other protein